MGLDEMRHPAPGDAIRPVLAREFAPFAPGVAAKPRCFALLDFGDEARNR